MNIVKSSRFTWAFVPITRLQAAKSCQAPDPSAAALNQPPSTEDLLHGSCGEEAAAGLFCGGNHGSTATLGKHVCTAHSLSGCARRVARLHGGCAGVAVCGCASRRMTAGDPTRRSVQPPLCRPHTCSIKGVTKAQLTRRIGLHSREPPNPCSALDLILELLGTP
ncbi:unnamed protein product [Mesocestoides corti]|uniref:Secreted protein n=1 Tax=Mesocestoides corti TaxID=53468 RepID=A0A158QUB3_MESCO|nr:unnamed protein product [Mesocestoides corti]